MDARFVQPTSQGPALSAHDSLPGSAMVPVRPPSLFSPSLFGLNPATDLVSPPDWQDAELFLGHLRDLLPLDIKDLPVTSKLEQLPRRYIK